MAVGVTAKGAPATIGDGEAKALAPAGTTADVASWLPAKRVKLTVSPRVMVTEAGLYWSAAVPSVFWPTSTVVVETAFAASLLKMATPAISAMNVSNPSAASFGVLLLLLFLSIAINFLCCVQRRIDTETPPQFVKVWHGKVRNRASGGV